MTQLGPHFSLEELTVTAHRQLDNTPDAAHVEHLKDVLVPGLEKVRATLAKPMNILSGYRSPAVNKAVGGATNSAHMLGYAADFICPQFGTPFDVCKALAGSGIPFDQIIYEYGQWTHISFDPRLRGEVLTKLTGQPYRPGLHQT